MVNESKILRRHGDSRAFIVATRTFKMRIDSNIRREKAAKFDEYEENKA